MAAQDPKDPNGHEQPPDTALGEVLKEFEDAETDVRHEPFEDDEHDGQAGDALSPNEAAQESVDGDA
ncbi:hypothetical protein ABZ916_15905 [Streptomyces sp. NPDC046853]|uniref:hypothetical protein n=1 Tax=Streptomyces sp. NPDC046853 TaxID=3154920 RepID=UPI003402C501